MYTPEQLRKRLNANRIEREILSEMQAEHKFKCSKRRCQRCALFRKQLKALHSERQWIDERLPAAEASTDE